MRALIGLVSGLGILAFSQEQTASNEDKFTPDHYIQAKTIAEADSIYADFFKNRTHKKGDMSKHFRIWRQSALANSDALGRIQHNLATPVPPSTRFMAPPALTAAPNWQAIGPFSWDRTLNSGWNPGVGRLNSVTEDPKNSSIIYACSPAGGAWKSTNAGSTWTNITDHHGIYGCSDIVVDHQNSSILYMLTGDRDGWNTPNGTGVWKSTDAGATWTQTAHNFSSFAGYHMRMHPTNNQIIVASSNKGVYITKDAGSTWSQITASYEGFEDIEFIPGSPNKLAMSFAGTVKIYDVSTNTSTNVSGLPTGINRSQLAVTPAAPNRLYISGAGSGGSVGIWWYDLNTSTLTQKMGAAVGNRINLQPYDTYASNGSTDAGQYSYDMAFAVSPLDANKVYHGIINVFISGDGGATWAQGCKWSEWDLCNNYTHADVHGIYTFGNRIYTVSDGGLFVSSDHMATTRDLTTGMNITMFYNFGQSPQDRSIMIGGTQDNGVFVQRNGKWTTELGADAFGGFVDLTNKDIMYYAYGSTMRSTNAFANGQSGNTQSNADEIKQMDQSPTDPNIMIGTGPNGLYRSTNRGVNFNLVQSGDFNSPFFVKSNANVAWAATADGQVYRSTNAGSSWNAVNTGLPSTAYTAGLTVDPNDANIAWLALTGTRSDKIYKTTNGGASWSDYTSTGFTEGAQAVAAGGQGNGDVYLGTSTGVYYRDNSLTSWQSWSTGLPWVQIQQLYVHSADQKLRAVTWGRGIWEADLKGTASSSSSTVSSSSLGSSSSTLSSSSVLSSSSAISSSANGVDCSPYPTWTNKAYNWTASKEYVVWTSQLWSHTNWVGGEPGIDVLWLNEGACASSSSSSSSSSVSSSSGLSSSSTLSSSSNVIVPTLGYKVLFKQESGIILAQRTSTSGNFAMQLVDAQGKIIQVANSLNGTDFQLKLQGIGQGHYYLRINDQGQIHSQSVQIQ